MAKNANLHTAKAAKNDEFYTRYEDIEKELKNYKDFFKGKVVFCNCGDAIHHNFGRYFSLNFEHLGLKKLICTSFDINGGHGKVAIYEGDKNGNRIPDPEEWDIKELEGNGDFRSEECVELLKQSDVVVSNPPFSLFREYVAQIMEYGKKFLIIGNTNGITYKEIFPYIKNNEMWLGTSSFNSGMYFYVPKDFEYSKNYKFKREIDGKKVARVSSICWFTNINHAKRNQPLDLYKHYSNESYPKYDNYDAIECPKVADIPMDYDGVIGVPITFLDKYCPTQFEIVDAREVALNDKQRNKSTYLIKDNDGTINGKTTYARICIRLKK